jgi:AbrB family looped-hinge helix DNA binding protein
MISMPPRKDFPASPLELQFHGATIVGERGQAVIPAEARKAHGLKKGEKLLVFSMGDNIVFTKVSGLEKFESHLTRRLGAIRELIEKNK